MAMVNVVMTREVLIERLKAKLPEAEAKDKAALAEHRKREKEYLKEFKKACREAAGWDYETAKAHGWSVPRPTVTDANGGSRVRFGGLSCPRSKATELKRVIAQLEQTTQTKFTLSERGGTPRSGGSSSSRSCPRTPTSAAEAQDLAASAASHGSDDPQQKAGDR